MNKAVRDQSHRIKNLIMVIELVTKVTVIPHSTDSKQTWAPGRQLGTI